MSTEEFSTGGLLVLLDKIKDGILNGTLDESSQEYLWRVLTFNKNDPDSQEVIKYLFTGWWVHSNFCGKETAEASQDAT